MRLFFRVYGKTTTKNRQGQGALYLQISDDKKNLIKKAYQPGQKPERYQ